MCTERYLCFTKMFDSLFDDNEHHVTPLSSKNPHEAVNRVIVGTEEGGKDAKHNVNNVTMDTLFHSPVTLNAQNKDGNMTNERQISADIHAETMK